MKNFSLKIFIDFDGTISLKDIGEEFFLHFADTGKTKKIIADWIDEKMTAPEMWGKLCNLVSSYNELSFQNLLSQIQIDDNFYSFLEMCKANDISCHIVSDGFDLYINQMLQLENYPELKIFCNKLEVNKNTVTPSFPYSDEECKKCANCKRNHIINNSSDDDITVYIGDGMSDTCAAQFCDYIIAKNHLLKFCEINRISYFPFVNFYNVIKRIEELNNKRRLKKRHQAFLKRKEVYEQG